MSVTVALQVKAAIPQSCKVENITEDLRPSRDEGEATLDSKIANRKSHIELATPVGGRFLSTNFSNPASSGLGYIDDLKIGDPRQVGSSCQIGIKVLSNLPAGPDGEKRVLEALRIEYDKHGVPFRQIIDVTDGIKVKQPTAIDVAREVKLPADQVIQLVERPNGSERAGEFSKFGIQYKTESGELKTSRFKNSETLPPIDHVAISPVYEAKAGLDTMKFVQVTSFDKAGNIQDRAFYHYGAKGVIFAIDTLSDGKALEQPRQTDFVK